MDTFPRASIHPTAVVSSDALVADDVTVGAFTLIHAGVVVDAGSTIGSHCVLGEPAAPAYGAEPPPPMPSRIGAGALVRSHTVVYEGVTVGPGWQTGHRVTVREGSTVGAHVRLGTGCDLQGELEIGDHARLHSDVFVASGTVIDEFAWVLPGVVFTNDPHPPSDTCLAGARVRRFAVVAARAVLLPGIEVGEHALVGAASVVTRDVPARTVAVGSPAQVVGPVDDVRCRHGRLEQVYPWPAHFRRGYPDGALPGDAGP